MPFTIDYKLTGSGWADCTISDGEQSCTITASYLADALGDLVLAANALLQWFNGVSFSFIEEPGEYRWEFTRRQGIDFELKVSDCYDVHGRENHILFQTVITPEVFGRAVHESATKILAEYGEDGYLEKWVLYPFPAEGLNQLTRQLVKISAT